MRIMSAVKFSYGLGIAFAGLRLDQYAFLEMRFEEALQSYEKCCAIMAMPVGIAARHNLSIVYLYLHLRIARQRAIERVEQQTAIEPVPWWHIPSSLSLRSL